MRSLIRPSACPAPGRARALWAAALTTLALPCAALAGQIGPVEDAVPPNVIFVVDASSSMVGCLSGNLFDADGNGSNETCTENKLTAVKNALKDSIGGLGEAWIALSQTDPNINYEGLGSLPVINPVFPSVRPGIMVPLGASRERFIDGLDDLTLSSRDGVTLAESLRDIVRYLNTGYYHCSDTTLCATSPMTYSCQERENYIIVITDGTSEGPYALGADGSPFFNTYASPSPDIDDSDNPAFDDLAWFMARRDFNLLLPGSPRAYTYVISLDIPSTFAHRFDEDLFDSVATNAGTRHLQVHSSDELRHALTTIYADITEGSHEESPPVLSVFGDRLLVGWYETAAGSPLYRGNLKSREIDVDPQSPTFGTFLTNSWSEWDAGELLRTRAVSSAESRESANGNNGDGARDIFTNINLDPVPDAFDNSNLFSLCPLMLDTSAPVATGADSTGVRAGHDINGDGIVDATDCQELIDFVRGDPLADFLPGTGARGPWKLGSIRHSLPVIAEPRPLIFTRNPALRAFLDQRLPEDLDPCPTSSTAGTPRCTARVAFVTADDGMIHAFNAQSGEELWAYIPRNLLGQTATSTVERAELRDLMWGEQPILDASPTIAFVWIDGYQGEGVIGATDGEQTASEWLRVLLVGEGEGGRYNIALDITKPDEPFILWEDTAATLTTLRVGSTTSKPEVGMVVDPDGLKWATFYGSGTHVEDDPLEARLYIRSIEDLQGVTESFPDAGFSVKVDLNQDTVHDGVGLSSDPLVLDRNSDGLVDEVYLASENGALYKFDIDQADVSDTAGCLFFDPERAYLDTGVGPIAKGLRTPTQFPPTAALNGHGQLLLFWGTGSTRDMFAKDRGYFYVMTSSPGCYQAELFTDCSTDGVVPLGLGERLMGSPVVYNGVVYFTTYAPASDRCDDGQSRLYGLEYETCLAAMDTNRSGVHGDGDALFEVLGPGLPSAPVIANGHIYVATSNPSGDPDEHVIPLDDDPFSGTSAIQWRELY